MLHRPVKTIYSAVLIDSFRTKLLNDLAVTYAVGVTSVILKKIWSNEELGRYSALYSDLTRMKRPLVSLSWICNFPEPTILFINCSIRLKMSFVCHKKKVLKQYLEFHYAELIPLGRILDIFDGQLTSVLMFAVSCSEISVGLTAMMILKVLTDALLYLLMFLDLFAHFTLNALYFPTNAVPEAERCFRLFESSHQSQNYWW